MVLHNSPELMQNDVHLLNALMAQWGPCQFFRRGPLQEVKGVMALLERLVGSPTGIHNKPHTTSRRSCECLNKKMGPWNVPVFFHPLSVLPSDYNEPPGTGIPDGLLELIIRLHLLLSGHLGPPDTTFPLLWQNRDRKVADQVIHHIPSHTSHLNSVAQIQCLVLHQALTNGGLVKAWIHQSLICSPLNTHRF